MTLATLSLSLSLSLFLSRHQAKGHWGQLRKRMGDKVKGSAKNRAEGIKHSGWSKRLGTKKKTKMQSHLKSVLGREEEIKGRDLRRIERQINKIKASCLVALLEDLPFAVLNFFILRVATQLTSTIITVRMNISRQFRTRVAIPSITDCSPCTCCKPIRPVALKVCLALWHVLCCRLCCRTYRQLCSPDFTLRSPAPWAAPPSPHLALHRAYC